MYIYPEYTSPCRDIPCYIHIARARVCMETRTVCTISYIAGIIQVAITARNESLFEDAYIVYARTTVEVKDPLDVYFFFFCPFEKGRARA